MARPTDAEVIALIEDIQDEFPRYGYRRVMHELRRRGLLVNHKKVARIMRLAGLGIRPRKRYVRTTDSRHDNPIHPNLYRNNIPSCLDQVWVADFTYIRIAQGFCYLAVILDACSWKVIGYALSQRLDTPLALAALQSAVASRRPPAGCIHHTDRGGQYASQLYREALEAAGLSTAVQYPATRRSKIRPRGGDRRHGARAYQIAGACHGALAPWAKTAPSDFRTFVAAFGQCCWRDDNSRRSSRGC